MKDFICQNSLYLCIIMSVVLHFLFLNRKKEELKVNSLILFIISILCNIFCILSSKILYYIEYAISNNGLLPDVIFDTGFSFFGTVFSAPIFYYLVARILKIDVKKMLDISTPAVLISSFCCRLNCMFAGCCTGIPFLNTAIRVPTREIELACYIGILVLIIYKEKKNTLITGTAYPLYLLIYGIVRIAEEPFRIAFKDDKIHFAFIHSAIAILIGIVCLLLITKNDNKEKSENK